MNTGRGPVDAGEKGGVTAAKGEEEEREQEMRRNQKGEE
jgi:hypothetical protein